MEDSPAARLELGAEQAWRTTLPRVVLRPGSYHAFGLIGTTFRELGWKTLIFSRERFR
jgi:hypothetical protein